MQSKMISNEMVDPTSSMLHHSDYSMFNIKECSDLLKNLDQVQTQQS